MITKEFILEDNLTVSEFYFTRFLWTFRIKRKTPYPGVELGDGRVVVHPDYIKKRAEYFRELIERRIWGS